MDRAGSEDRGTEELTEEEKNEYQTMLTKFFPEKETNREETSPDKAQ